MTDSYLLLIWVTPVIALALMVLWLRVIWPSPGSRRSRLNRRAPSGFQNPSFMSFATPSASHATPQGSLATPEKKHLMVQPGAENNGSSSDKIPKPEDPILPPLPEKKSTDKTPAFDP